VLLNHLLELLTIGACRDWDLFSQRDCSHGDHPKNALGDRRIPEEKSWSYALPASCRTPGLMSASVIEFKTPSTAELMACQTGRSPQPGAY